MYSELYRNEMLKISQSDMIPWELLRNKSIMVTGATGLIGKVIVHSLLLAEEEKKLKLKIYVLVRNVKKAHDLFNDYASKSLIIVEHADIKNPVLLIDKIDYIIHGANPTESKYFIEHAAETSKTAFLGTMNILEFAKQQEISSMLFLSTMEVYGYPEKGHKVTEGEIGGFDTTKARNCYPISKQICENLCCSYYQEYHVPAKIARLTQTFGIGVNYNDNRVFAEFARCAIEKKNIILKTQGLTERCYLDVTDAVAAILLVLLNGENGQAYTVANEETYCSIYDMAKLVAEEYDVHVIIEEQDITRYGYASELYMDLDTSKLKALGWCPQTDLRGMYRKMIAEMRLANEEGSCCGE